MKKTGICIFTAPGPPDSADRSQGGPGAFSDPLLACAAQRYMALAGEPAGATDWQVERPPGGKPYFRNRADLHFSLSHSGAFWVCAMAWQPVGLDLQLHRPCSQLALARRFFSLDEQAYLLRSANEADFFLLWTAKESFVKYAGMGITGEFSHFSVAGPEGLRDRVQDVQLRFLPCPAGYTLCLCAPVIQRVSFYALA